jgi:hypothetical protein
MVAVQSLRRCILDKPIAQGLRKFDGSSKPEKMYLG